MATVEDYNNHRYTPTYTYTSRKVMMQLKVTCMNTTAWYTIQQTQGRPYEFELGNGCRGNEY